MNSADQDKEIESFRREITN